MLGTTIPADGGAMPAVLPIIIAGARLEAQDDPPRISRRGILRGAVVGVVALGATHAHAVDSDDELSRLIEAVKAARAEESRRCDIVCAFEDRVGVGRVDLAEYHELREYSGQAYDDAEGVFAALLAYQPKNMEEVRRRCDFILADNVWLMCEVGEGDLEAFLRSMATSPAEVA